MSLYVQVPIQQIADGLTAIGWSSGGGGGDASLSYGATAPSAPINGTLWWDTTATLLKLYTGGTWTTINVSAETIATISGYATTAQSAASTATQKLTEFKAIQVTATTLSAGASATASYNSGTGVITLGIPTGATGQGLSPKGTDTAANIILKVGTNGDYWIASDTGDGYIYDGSAWTNVGAVRGPQGTQGIQGIQGLQGIQGPVGEVSLAQLNAALASVESAMVAKPVITSPTSGTIDFTGAVTATYDTADTFAGAQDYVKWEAGNSDFSVIYDSYEGASNLLSWTPSIGLALATVYVRVTQGSDNHRSVVSSVINFVTHNIYTETPTLTVTGTPSDVTETPTLTTSAFSVYNGTDTHVSTDWQITQDGTVMWESLANSANKLSITIPSGILEVSTAYVFKARHNGTAYGSSAWVEVSGTTKSAFAIPVGIAGTLGFGVAPSSEAFALLGLSEMTGTTTTGHDNYGNYQHTNGSIVVHIPKFYYRVGNASAPQYATYGVNSLEIAGTETFASEAAANAAGYALHRAFIDGNVEKGGFFIDKYICSKKVGDTNVAVSVKNGNPISLTTNATYTPSSTMTGCTGILSDAVTLSRARGAGWNATSVFMVGALAMLSLAHGQRSTSTTYCAWYNATYNFPKGCNNGSRADVNDTSVTWSASPDTAGKGLTGSASTFAKSTHNGQNNGVADLNGLMYQVTIGMTNIGTSATDTAQIATNTIYLLKTTAYLKNLTAGWGGATDAWGNTTNLSTMFSAVTSPITVSASAGVFWGSGTNQVFNPALSGVGRDLCGFLPKDDAAADGTGTSQFGNDQCYKYNRANMVVFSGCYWGGSATAGLFCRYLNYSRSLADTGGGFRGCAYVA